MTTPFPAGAWRSSAPWPTAGAPGVRSRPGKSSGPGSTWTA